MRYERVNRITKRAIRQEVHNFSVEKYGTYIANGIIVHNCYIKAAAADRAQMGSEALRTMMWKLASGEGLVLAKQLTLAVDALPDDEETRDIMLYGLERFLNYAWIHKGKREFHATVNTPTDLLPYIQYLKTPAHLDWLSISHLHKSADVDLVRAVFFHLVQRSIKVNWNVYLGEFLHLFKEDRERWLKLISSLDHVYILVYKDASHGRMVSSQQVHLLSEVQEAFSTLSPQNRGKIEIDHCIRDSTKSLSSGYGCSANISRFHIWPDGQVTGCPYNTTNYEGDGQLHDWYDSFIKAKGRYEFRDCRIPEALTTSKVPHLLTVL